MRSFTGHLYSLRYVIFITGISAAKSNVVLTTFFQVLYKYIDSFNHLNNSTGRCHYYPVSQI